MPTWTSFGYDTVIDCYNFRTEGEQVGGTLLKIKLNLTRDRMYSNIVTLKKWNRVIRRHAESWERTLNDPTFRGKKQMLNPVLWKSLESRLTHSIRGRKDM